MRSSITTTAQTIEKIHQ